MSRRGKLIRGKANKKLFRKGYYKALSRSIVGVPMARNGGHL